MGKKKIWAEFTCKRDMEQKSGAGERQWLSCAVMKREDELFHGERKLDEAWERSSLQRGENTRPPLALARAGGREEQITMITKEKLDMTEQMNPTSWSYLARMCLLSFLSPLNQT